MDYQSIARDLLNDIRATFKWAKVPKDQEESKRIEAAWAGALKAGGVVYPPNIYREALQSYMAGASARDDAPMPGDILRHCWVVVERAERDPQRRAALEKWRDERRGIKS